MKLDNQTEQARQAHAKHIDAMTPPVGNFKAENEIYQEIAQLQLAKEQEQAMRASQAQAVQQMDPFMASQYAQHPGHDVPVNYGGNMADTLLNDNEVPEAMKKEFWWVMHKDNTLTFLDKDRKAAKLLTFDIAMIDILNTIPYYKYNFKTELDKTVLRNVFETKLDRALGFAGQNIKNERIMLQSQFQENKNINESSDTGTRVGFFKKMFGRK